VAAYGRFDIVDPSSADYQHIIRTQGRAVQLQALDNPDAYDVDTDELYSWFRPGGGSPREIIPSAAVIDEVAKTKRNGRAPKGR